MWKRWLKLFSFVEYIILTLNCNKSICLVIESPLKGIRMSLVWTSKEVVSHIEKETMGLSIFNPLSPDSDQHQFSPNNIQWLSRDTVKRINKLMITKAKYLDLLLNSLDWFLKEMYGDQFGEFVCRYYIKAWICHCHLLPFLLCYSVYYKVSLLLTSVPLFLIPKKKNHKALYTKNLESGGHSIISTSPSMDEIF